MAVLAFVTNSENAATVAAWCYAIKDDFEEVEYVCFDQDGDLSTEPALRAILELEPSISVSSITTIDSGLPVTEVLDRCRKTKPRVLVTAEFSFDESGAHRQTSEDLIRAAPCLSICPMQGVWGPADVQSILMIASRGIHDPTVLRITELLRQRCEASVTLATVEDELGSKAERAGEKAMRSLINDSGLDEDHFEIKVVVDQDRRRGILKCIDDHELIICGKDLADELQQVQQPLGNSTSLIVKRAPPLRLKSLAEWLPRINPRDHADLLQDLRQGSRWNSDFVSMLALASAIASLGLMQNSPAVVIGSMLLAPLMTPMIGAGIALAQANLRLATECAKTIFLGLLLTLAVSFALGMITPSRETLSPEVISRGSPNVLDLLIALFAAVAATIAMARPNIAGAIAGVAIATALVPPICAVGLSLSLGDYANATGALLLFGTNLVAIIVASSFTFSLLGVMTIRSPPRHRQIIGFTRWGLVVLLVILAGPLSYMLVSQLEEGRSQTALFPVTRAVSRALHARVEKDPGVHITFLGRPSVSDAVVIHIAANHNLPKSYAKELRNIVQSEMADPELPVYIVCLRGQWMNTPYVHPID